MTAEKTMLIDRLIEQKVQKLIAIRERNANVYLHRQIAKKANDKDFQEAMRLDEEIKRLTN